MKIKLTITILALVAVALSGCFNPANKLVKALATDPATLNLQVTTVWGTITLNRTNPGSNTLAHSVSPDGRINVTKGK